MTNDRFEDDLQSCYTYLLDLFERTSGLFKFVSGALDERDWRPWPEQTTSGLQSPLSPNFDRVRRWVVAFGSRAFVRSSAEAKDLITEVLSLGIMFHDPEGKRPPTLHGMRFEFPQGIGSKDWNWEWYRDAVVEPEPAWLDSTGVPPAWEVRPRPGREVAWCKLKRVSIFETRLGGIRCEEDVRMKVIEPMLALADTPLDKIRSMLAVQAGR